MLTLRRAFLFLIVVTGLPVSGGSEASRVGVLVMAHGGSPVWNRTVKDMVKEAGIEHPTRIYFGMGHTKEEADLLQAAIKHLEGKRVHTIVVIPLLVSSYSEIYRQWRYLLGVDVNPGFNSTSFFPVTRRATIEFGEPFNDDPIISLILLDRAREISQNPGQESVVLVAHGPNDDSDNARWMQMLSRVCRTIQVRGRFKSVQGMTLRDDAPNEIRSQAVASLRGHVEAIGKEGSRALVIPYLIAPGGIENKVGIALKGLDYTLNAKVVAPDHRLAQWIRSKIP
ncbi:MAG: hypothetical protein A2992_04645 [Elusimicrobia bacterium RIFCSPLOWO2_01_FULL_59_12]|nr:MAG: hypothetical protein A2992_04645 [Elusimicrobia bacterium RIFCSPLOWO2_01_FULL_59_12]